MATCSSCGTEGAPRRQGTGSFAVELALWVLGFVGWEIWHWISLLIPIGYTIYRIAGGTKQVCRACGASAPRGFAGRAGLHGDAN